MKTKALFTMLVSVAMILTTPLVTLGAGPGGGGGSGGGGGNAGDAAGALYGDLYVIERDGAGVPIPREVTYPDPETGADVTVSCLQPLAENCSLLRLWGEQGGFDPEVYDPCAVYVDDATLLQTVSFGRESVSRSPATVIDKSYAEAIKAINLALPSCGDTRAIKLDPAGRITLCLGTEVDGTTTYAWKTIDAPLENLGLYRAVMTNGCFGPVTDNVVGEEGVPIIVTYELSGAAIDNLMYSGLGHLVCADDDALPEIKTKADMLSAAVFIAAGADKTSPINLDEIINLNTYLGVNTYTYVRVKKERILTVTYFPFKVDGAWFTYDLGVDACVDPTYATLLKEVNNEGSFSIDPALNVFGVSPPGVDLRLGNGVAITVCRVGYPLQDSGINVVCDNPTSAGCGGANWFAQAAEDARKTIWYLHNWRVPEIAY